MKKIIAILVGLSGIVAAQAQNGDLFQPSEFNVSVFGGWVDKDDSDLAPGVGVTYFVTRHIGVGAFTHWDNFDGKFLDNISGEAHFRMPLGDLPLAPYGLVAIGYSFESEETFESFGGGAEWRFSDRLGVFADVRWQINNDTDDGVAIRAGVRFPF